MSEWKELTMDDVCTVTDCLHKTAPSVNKQTPYKMLRTVNIRNGRILRENIKYVTKETYEKWSVRGYLKRNDIILTREAPMGEAAIIKSNENFFLGQRMLQIEADTTKIIPDFLYYSFLAPHLQNQIKKHEGTGSVVSNIRIPELKNMKILLPSFKEQKNIVSILRSIDEKIELNLQINETLEQMAMTLYKHWFVDFGPFQDSEFVESELGMIPKGWGISSLSKFMKIKNKSVNPKKINEDKTLIHFSIPALDMDFPYFEKASDIKSNKYAIENNSILLSKLNPRFYRIWTVYKDDFHDGLPVCSPEFIVYEPKLEIDWSFLNAYLRSNIFIDKFRSHASGTTGSRQRVTPKVTLNFNTVEPPKYIREQFNNICKPYWDLIHKNTLEIQTLKETRDYLLPKLLSGEIDLSDAEKEVEQVL